MSENEVALVVGVAVAVLAAVAVLWMRSLANRLYGPAEKRGENEGDDLVTIGALVLIAGAFGVVVAVSAFVALLVTGEWSAWLWLLPVVAVAWGVHRVNAWAARRQRAREGDL